jgi:predicted NUDIX family phosphoesterase
MSQIVTPKQPSYAKATAGKPLHDEHILVVRRTHLFTAPDAWHGLKELNFDHYMHIIDHRKEFHPRSIMETNPTYKQIIPYLIFTHDDKYFLMQRKSDASETRLRNKLTLGIGGHIREEDLKRDLSAVLRQAQDERGAKDSLVVWAMREFHEEVNYAGNLTVKPLGIINDDSNDVGKVHIGFALLLCGDSSEISVKSELKSGELVSLDDCIIQKESMESWSQFVVDCLHNKKQ